jgi:cell shape-determining protein MreC
MSSYADFIANWFHLVTAVNANAEDLESLVEINVDLEAAAANARRLNNRRSALRAELTQNTKDLHVAMRTGRDMATRLRSGVRSQFGNRNEKLLEFNMRPFRGRVLKEEGPEAGGGVTPPPPTTE